MQASTDAGFHRHRRSQEKSFSSAFSPGKGGPLSPHPSTRNFPLGRVPAAWANRASSAAGEKPCLMVRAVDGAFTGLRSGSTGWALEDAGHKTGPSMATALFHSRRVIGH